MRENGPPSQLFSVIDAVASAKREQAVAGMVASVMFIRRDCLTRTRSSFASLDSPKGEYFVSSLSAGHAYVMFNYAGGFSPRLVNRFTYPSDALVNRFIAIAHLRRLMFYAFSIVNT